MTKFFIEFLRVFLIFIIGGVILGFFSQIVYSAAGYNLTNTNGNLVVGLAILIVLFVLYRNKLQFTGFYQKKERKKLGGFVSFSLISISIVMFLVAPIFSGS